MSTLIYISRKRPLDVEVMQFTGSEENLLALKVWSNSQVFLSPKDSKMLKVQCLEALAETPIGSYICKGVKGEVWPIREDIFLETYEVIESYDYTKRR